MNVVQSGEGFLSFSSLFRFSVFSIWRNFSDEVYSCLVRQIIFQIFVDGTFERDRSSLHLLLIILSYLFFSYAHLLLFLFSFSILFLSSLSCLRTSPLKLISFKFYLTKSVKLQKKSYRHDLTQESFAFATQTLGTIERCYLALYLWTRNVRGSWYWKGDQRVLKPLSPSPLSLYLVWIRVFLRCRFVSRQALMLPTALILLFVEWQSHRT